jgi:hypothetical protein
MLLPLALLVVLVATGFAVRSPAKYSDARAGVVRPPLVAVALDRARASD